MSNNDLEYDYPNAFIPFFGPLLLWDVPPPWISV